MAARLDAISRACPDCAIHLDDVDRARGYYTGLRFHAYDRASRSTIAQGGRYDNLYEKFGASAPAVGFTITCE
jgi:ATP phosphoribosyltransferase regulatory subunit